MNASHDDAPPDRGVMLITGGSRGIGAATALRAARDGWNVAIVYRDRDAEASAVVEAVRGAGRRALAVRTDLRDPVQITAAFAAADALGPLTALINNAAVTGGVARVDGLRTEALDDVLSINVRAPFLCAAEAIRRMSTRCGGQGGAIVNVGSGASQLGTAGVWVHYAASKGALDTMTIGLSKEVAAEGIRVNGVRPGLIDTEIHAARPPGQIERIAAEIPMGRIGTPQEIASVIVWLADAQASSYVTGALIDARGGR